MAGGTNIENENCFVRTALLSNFRYFSELLNCLFFSSSSDYYTNLMNQLSKSSLNVLENHSFRVLECLNVHFNGTFKDIGKDFFRVPDQEVHFSRSNGLDYNSR